MPDKIIEYRGAQILESEAEVLKKLEEITKSHFIFKEKNKYSINRFSLKAEDNRVISISLLELKPDKLSESIELLKSLKSLNALSLISNHLKRLPNSFQELKNLEYLTLKYNDFREFPDVICKNITLKYLDISQNNIKSIPSSIGNLSSLEILDFTNNPIYYIPDTIDNLKSLEHLSLRATLLNQLPDGICKLLSLKSLDLGFIQTLKKIPDTLKQLVNLKSLNLKETPISSLPHYWELLPSLESIGLSSAQKRKFPYLRQKKTRDVFISKKYDEGEESFHKYIRRSRDLAFFSLYQEEDLFPPFFREGANKFINTESVGFLVSTFELLQEEELNEANFEDEKVKQFVLMLLDTEGIPEEREIEKYPFCKDIVDKLINIGTDAFLFELFASIYLYTTNKEDALDTFNSIENCLTRDGFRDDYYDQSMFGLYENYREEILNFGDKRTKNKKNYIDTLQQIKDDLSSLESNPIKERKAEIDKKINYVRNNCKVKWKKKPKQLNLDFFS